MSVIYNLGTFHREEQAWERPWTSRLDKILDDKVRYFLRSPPPTPIGTVTDGDFVLTRTQVTFLVADFLQR